MVRAGKYIQGGGCMTVGVAGLVSSGGFGSLSKGFGTVASNLLEAEVVTADGRVRTVSNWSEPDLFWALKGGGSTFGVITRVTLRTHLLPEHVGDVTADITAADESSFAELIELAMDFCGRKLLTPYWGEQIKFRPRNRMEVRAAFQGLNKQAAEAIWAEFFDAVRSRAPSLSLDSASIVTVPGRDAWDSAFLKSLPGVVVADDRLDSDPANIYWAGDAGQAGQFIHAYSSVWLPASLLSRPNRSRFVDALSQTAKEWSVSLHLNKGLAGAAEEVIEAGRDTATNPEVADAFALAILGAEEEPAYPGVSGHEPNFRQARHAAATVRSAAGHLRRLLPAPASYVAESDYFEENWAQAFWGSNYPRLLRVKNRYDPQGLFFAHHMVGSERWSPDGFREL